MPTAVIWAFVVVVLMGGVAVAQLLWNWLVPGLFGLPEIGYFQMAGLMVLGRLLVATK